MKHIIKESRMNIRQIFNSFDKSRDGYLDRKELTELLRVIKDDVRY